MKKENSDKNKYFNKVGGMALMDGVMMKSENKIATATRLSDGDIRVDETIYEENDFKKKIKKIPVVRGIFAFIDSMLSGIKELSKSAQLLDYENEDGETENLTDKDIAISFIIAMILAVVLFMLIPNLVTNFFFPLKEVSNKMAYLFTEAALKIGMFLGYIALVSNLAEIKTVFKYHGAEHKAIACLESGKKVDVKNAKNSVRFHPRCGTSFIVLVLLISIAVSYFIPSNNFLIRLSLKIMLLPVIAGLSFEAITLSNKFNNILTKIIKYPGLMLQRVTTKEPDEKQLECAIAAMLAAISEYNYITIQNALKEFNKKYNIETNDALRIIEAYLEEDKNKLYMNMDSKYLDYASYINIENRVKKFKVDNIPLQYIIGTQMFYGLEFNVQQGILVPRADTEILVEQALAIIKEKEYKTAIDMCCGSGCIGITVAKESSLESIICADISETAKKVTKQNILKHEMQNVKFEKTDLFTKLKDIKVDIIMSNPPYIETEEIKKLDKIVQNEPILALDGGKTGLEFYEKIADEARNHLTDGGTLIFEIGYNQGLKVKNILKKYKEYSNIEVIKDLGKNERVVVCHFHKI